MEYHVVGENIRKFRKRLKLTQDELADRVGVTWEMISRYERGENSPMNKLANIAEALNISISDLVDSDRENLYQIPLFTNIPKDLKFKKENTLLFYNCPTWIIKSDPDSFIIETSLVNSSNFINNSRGFLFISPNIDLNINDLILLGQKRSISIERFTVNSQNILGKLVMQEIVF